jgi:hypothetical protein
MTQPTNPLTDPAVIAALNNFATAGAALTTAALRDAPAAGEIGEGTEALVSGIIDISDCVLGVLALAADA